MSKSIKIFAIILLIFSFIINFYGVYATDINMNLTSDVQTPSQIESEQNLTDNLNVDNSNLETGLEGNLGQASNEITASPVDNQTVSSTIADSDTITTPSSIGSVQEEGLGLSNILSILLITVGVILILLAIAIIIRLK